MAGRREAVLTEQEPEQEDTMKGRFLAFAIGKETYGIEIRHVIEIIGLQPVTEVPELPEYIRGIINLRGKVIPVMDVRLRFKKAFQEYNDRTCIIVSDIDGIYIGLIVDRVSEVLSIPDGEIVLPPKVQNAGNAYIKGIGKTEDGVKLLLDCSKLLEQESVDILRHSDQGGSEYEMVC